jgi:hypothetical protein
VYDRTDTLEQVCRCPIACCATRSAQWQLSAGWCGTCCMHRLVQHAKTAWYSQQGLSVRSNTLQQVHRCLQQTEQVALVRCSLLLSAGCCVVAACSFVHHWYRLQGMSDRVNNTQTSMHTYTACCATPLVSCSCLQAVLNTVVCTALQGLCNMATQPNTGCKACLTASTHANRHAHLYSSVLQLSLCSCGCLQSILVTAVCTGFVQHVLKPGTACRSTIPTQHFQIGAVMSASMLGSLSCSYAGVCC